MSAQIAAPKRALPVRQQRRLATTGPGAAWTLSSWDGSLRCFLSPECTVTFRTRHDKNVTCYACGPASRAYRFTGPFRRDRGSFATRAHRPVAKGESESEWKPRRDVFHGEIMRVAVARAPRECDRCVGGGVSCRASEARAGIIRPWIARAGGAIPGCKSQMNARPCSRSGHESCVGPLARFWCEANIRLQSIRSAVAATFQPMFQPEKQLKREPKFTGACMRGFHGCGLTKHSNNRGFFVL